MTTARKLWLGFGTLTLLLFITSGLIILRVRAIGGEVSAMAQARDLGVVAKQLQISSTKYALEVRTYIQNGDMRMRNAAREDVVEVEQHLKDYRRLATSKTQQALAKRFDALWAEVKTVGNRLLSSKNSEWTAAESRRLYEYRAELEELLDKKIQSDAVQTYNERRAISLEDVKAVTAFALALLVIGVLIAGITSAVIGSSIVKSERQIADAKTFADSIIETVREPLMVLDGLLTVVRANKAYYDTFGGEPDETETRALFELGEGRWNIPELRKLLEEILPKHSEVDDYLVEHDSRIMRLNARRLHRSGNNATLFLLAIHDVTDRELVSRAIEASEARKTAMFESALDCIISINHEGKIVEFNVAAEETFGFKRDDVIGRELAEVIIPVEYREAHCKGMAHFLATGEGPILNKRLEMSALRANGEVFLVELSVTRVELDGPPTFTAYLRDITERRRMEDELRQITADLSEADHRKNEFLAMLGHELRNPLTPLRHALTIAQQPGGEEAIRPLIPMMERQLQSMARLIDDLLDVSRISRGKVQLQMARTELSTIIEQAIEVARLACGEANHKLTLNLPQEPIYLDADAVRLAQVFGNLLNNACKYTEPGGRGRISLTAEREGSHVVVSIRDNGMGIAPEMLPKIFQMFAQADQSIERSQGGLGIGLSLVQRLVEMHGGSVEGKSEGLGRGSEFIVRLPIIVEDVAATTKLDPAAASTPVFRRILVVDDNIDAAKMLSQLLRLDGNEVFLAHDGLEAVEAAELHRPDVVLMDIGLPKLNGYEAAAKIRSHEWGKAMLLVALTGWGQDEDRRKSKEAGFDAHLVKPVEFAELNAVLEGRIP